MFPDTTAFGCSPTLGSNDHFFLGLHPSLQPSFSLSLRSHLPCFSSSLQMWLFLRVLNLLFLLILWMLYKRCRQHPQLWLPSTDYIPHTNNTQISIYNLDFSLRFQISAFKITRIFYNEIHFSFHLMQQFWSFKKLKCITKGEAILFFTSFCQFSQKLKWNNLSYTSPFIFIPPSLVP